MEDEEFEDLLDQLRQHKQRIDAIKEQFREAGRGVYQAQRSITQAIREQIAEDKEFCEQWESELGREIQRRRENGLPCSTEARIRRSYSFEVSDESIVPRYYLKLDDTKIRREVQESGGVPNIPGIEGVTVYRIKLTDE